MFTNALLGLAVFGLLLLAAVIVLSIDRRIMKGSEILWNRIAGLAVIVGVICMFLPAARLWSVDRELRELKAQRTVVSTTNEIVALHQ